MLQIFHLGKERGFVSEVRVIARADETSASLRNLALNCDLMMAKSENKFVFDDKSYFEILSMYD